MYALVRVCAHACCTLLMRVRYIRWHGQEGLFLAYLTSERVSQKVALNKTGSNASSSPKVLMPIFLAPAKEVERPSAPRSVASLLPSTLTDISASSRTFPAPSAVFLCSAWSHGPNYFGTGPEARNVANVGAGLSIANGLSPFWPDTSTAVTSKIKLNFQLEGSRRAKVGRE